jgi:preprotein translocase subunit YajC
MDDVGKAQSNQAAQKALSVGTKVKLTDGRIGRVTEISGNQITVTTGDGNIVEAQSQAVTPISDDGQESEPAA